MQLPKFRIASDNGMAELVLNAGLTQTPISVIMTTTTSTINMACVLNISIIRLLGLQRSDPVKELVHLEPCQ